jgi:uncharacterized protein YggE
MRHLLLLACSLALVAPALAQERAGPGDPPEIETVGTGERRVAPDRATVHLLIETRNPAAATAATLNARAVQAVRDTLRRLGLDSATTTASYNVGPDYEHPRPADEGPRRAGYVARTVLRVVLSRIDETGRVIDAGLARGATGVEGVMFESSTTDQARRDAIAEAARAARRDAEALARALGGRLGALLSSSTVAGNDPRRMNVMLGVTQGYAGSATEVTPNEIIVRAGVATRWRFIAD